jgi:hypothetical protein
MRRAAAGMGQHVQASAVVEEGTQLVGKVRILGQPLLSIGRPTRLDGTEVICQHNFELAVSFRRGA